MSLSIDLSGQRILLIGGTSGIALQIARQASDGGATVLLAGRRIDDVRARLRDAEIDATAMNCDLASEASIRALAADAGTLDAVICLASAPANGPLAQLEPTDIHAALDAKVVGPVLLAKHLHLSEQAVMILFSGIVAWRPAPGLAVMAATNAAVSALADAFALELAPRRALAVSPGIIDSGAWDGDNREAFLADTAAALPVKRVGQPANIADLVLAAIANPFLNATTLHIDGGAQVA